MNIIAYKYEADHRCIECSIQWAIKQSLKRGGNGAVRISENNLIEFQVAYFNGTIPDRDCVPNPVFSTDEWQKLACGDCHAIIEEEKSNAY